jgi:anti-anti-sigma regulatory factor
VAQRGTKVVVDLSQSPRINSRGLAMLVKLVCDANTHSSRVIFAAATPFVSSVIQVTRLNQFLELVGSLPEAVARVSAA